MLAAERRDWEIVGIREGYHGLLMQENFVEGGLMGEDVNNIIQVKSELSKSKGDTVTVTEAILRQWAASKDPRLQMYFFEVAYGKVPTTSNVNLDVTKLSDDDLQRIIKS